MMRLLKYFFFFALLVVILSWVTLQTPFAQQKIKAFIEKTVSEKTQGKLTIGELKGLLPIWCSLESVEYQSKEIESKFDHIRLFVSPASLLLGRLVLFHVHADEGSIRTKEESQNVSSIHRPLPAWPSLPLPVRIQSIQIDRLQINSMEAISISGNAELKDDFTADLILTAQALPQIVFHTTFEGSKKAKEVGFITHIQNSSPSLDLWLEGSVDWTTSLTKGSFYGNGFIQSSLKTPWKAMGDFALSRNGILSSPSFHFETDRFSSEGRLQYDLRSHSLTTQGSVLGDPYWLAANLNIDREGVKASFLRLHYGDNHLKGALAYSFQQKVIEGEIDLEIQDFSRLGLEHSLKGGGKGHISLKKEEMIFEVEGANLEWKDMRVEEMTLNGRFLDQTATFQLKLKEFKILDPAYEMLPTAYLQLAGTATEKRLNLEGNLWGMGSTPFSLSLDLPILFSRSTLDLSIDKTSPFTLRVQGRGAMDPLLAFLENASLIARGKIDVDLSLTGLWEKPEMKGHLTYKEGSIESLTTGALYRDINIHFEAVGRALQIRQFIAHDFDRGDLAGKGEILWDPSNGFPFNFDLFTSRFTLIATDAFRSKVNSEINLSGNLHEMTIKGNATVVEAHLSIPEKLPPQIPVIEVTYINPLPTQKPEEKENEKIITIHWDLAVEVPRHLVIEGRGLVSEWRGALHIAGEQNDLQYKGELSLVQGRFSLVGRFFDLTEGKIRIEGIDPKDIFVELKGDLELITITASIDITGTLDALQLAFSSTPPMSTNQILSWILFNQDVNELTPFQACQLANILVSFSGTRAGPKVFENIKEGLGIDVFSITNCDIDTTDLTFQVGKYISQGTFVGVNKSISGEFDSVTVQTRLYRNFFLEADYGGSLNGLTPNGGKIVFKWYKSY